MELKPTRPYRLDELLMTDFSYSVGSVNYLPELNQINFIDKNRVRGLSASIPLENCLREIQNLDSELVGDFVKVWLKINA